MLSRLLGGGRWLLAWIALGGLAWAVGCASVKSPSPSVKADQSTLNNPPKGVRCRIAMVTPVMNSKGVTQETDRWIEATISDVTPEAITVTKGVQRVRRDGGTAAKDGTAAKSGGEWDEMPLDKAVLPRKSIKSIDVI